ncbi:MAG: ABC transporter substrate-binding protein, partial [Bacteroidota bacterium]
DATEWVGPYHDYIMGFQEIAKYYYYPGWHEPGTSFEFFINKDKYDELPSDLQRIFEMATHFINLYTISELEYKNAEYLRKLEEVPGLTIAAFPPELIEEARLAADEVIAEYAASDPFAAKVYASIQDFRSKAIPWAKMTESVFYRDMMS